MICGVQGVSQGVNYLVSSFCIAGRTANLSQKTQVLYGYLFGLENRIDGRHDGSLALRHFAGRVKQRVAVALIHLR
jgi:hypothetical protein